jgi:hypothetical protein
MWRFGKNVEGIGSGLDWGIILALPCINEGKTTESQDGSRESNTGPPEYGNDLSPCSMKKED